MQITKSLIKLTLCVSLRVWLPTILFLGTIAQAGNNAALLIGVAQYEDSLIRDLQFADSDALELSNALIHYGGYERNCVITLTNSKATKDNIARAMRDLGGVCSPAGSLNNVLIYFSGHAVLASSRGDAHFSKRPDQEREFLAPYDVDLTKKTTFSDGSEENRTFISKEWFARQLKNLNARSVSITIDACHSGIPDFENLITSYMGFRKRGSGGQVHYVQSSGELIRNEYALLSASNEQNQAAELDELQHGALTYAILKKIRDFRQKVRGRANAPLFVDDVYNSVNTFFRERSVTYKDGQGQEKSSYVIELHQPQLFRFPRSQNQIVYANIAVDTDTKTGLVEIDADYADYDVFVDGKLAPIYKGRIFQFPTGERSVVLRVRETNYRHVLPVVVKEGAPQILSLSLRGDLLVQLVEPGFLSDSYIDDARVYLNGQRVGKTGHQLSGLLAGTYDLVVDYQGYKKSKQISIRPDSPLTVVYNLKFVDREKPKRDLGRIPF